LPGGPPAHDDAEVVAVDGVPDGIAAGASPQVSLTLRNTGNTTWTTADGYRLGAQAPAGTTVWGSATRELERPVEPGQTVTFTFTIQAPPAPNALFTWQMMRESNGTREWFGALTPPRQIARLVNNAVFVAQVVPTAVPRGSVATASVTIRNIGSTTWSPTTQHRLAALGADFGAARHELPGPVAPAQEVTFTFPLPPPAGPATFQWRMVQDGLGFFGTPSPPVTVVPTEPSACADLRDQMAELTLEIQDLQKERARAAPGEKGAITARINELSNRRTGLRQQAADLGCDP
jgi:hypothetical protein